MLLRHVSLSPRFLTLLPSGGGQGGLVVQSFRKIPRRRSEPNRLSLGTPCSSFYVGSQRNVSCPSVEIVRSSTRQLQNKETLCIYGNRIISLFIENSLERGGGRKGGGREKEKQKNIARGGKFPKYFHYVIPVLNVSSMLEVVFNGFGIIFGTRSLNLIF